MFPNALETGSGTTPPHDLDCCLARAALLTQEGSSAAFNTSGVRQCLKLTPILGYANLAKTNSDNCAWPVGAIVPDLESPRTFALLASFSDPIHSHFQ